MVGLLPGGRSHEITSRAIKFLYPPRGEVRFFSNFTFRAFFVFSDPQARQGQYNVGPGFGYTTIEEEEHLFRPIYVFSLYEGSTT